MTYNLKKEDLKINKVARKIKILRSLDPINLAKEKRRFFNLENYNPYFRYKKPKIDISELFRILDDISFDSSPLGILLEKKKKELVCLLSLWDNIGNNKKFTFYSKKAFGTPPQEIINKAKEELKFKKDKPIKKEGYLKESKIIKILEQSLKQYGLQEKKWKVSIAKGIVPNFSVDRFKKVLFVKRGIEVSRRDLRSITAHEIETHILRSENGGKQPYRIFRGGFPYYVECEEGLATFNGRRFLSKNDKKYYWQPLLLIAVSLALKKSFREVFEKLLEYGCSSEKAWNLSARVKRGLSDTSSPGGFTKDYLYFSGYLKVRNIIDRRNIIKKLYFGKTNIPDLDKIDTIDNLNHNILLPFFIENTIHDRKIYWRF